MSEAKLISPMLDNFVIGDAISNHHGVCCYPAMENDSDNKYIVKVISTPATQTQVDALLLSGAYPDKESVLAYYAQLTDDIVHEIRILEQLSSLSGFVGFLRHQIVPMEEEIGYDVYLLSEYKNTLQHVFRRNSLTHLGALNLGLDLCAALSACRQIGYMYVDLKPTNIYLTGENEYRVGDLGFLKLDTLKYASLPDKYRSQYTAPEIADAYSSLNTTIDVYALGLILYQVFNDGNLPFKEESAPAAEFPAPAYADYEMAEIILKACAPDPAERWQSPAEMGQALVSYMQRNGAHDAPIVPPIVAETDAFVEEAAVEAPSLPEVEENERLEIADEESLEDEVCNITFLLAEADETAPGEFADDIDYEDVSSELTDMLQQADELIAHQTPEPVIAPEPIDVPVPEPEPVEEIEGQLDMFSDETTESESATEENPKDEVQCEESETAAPEESTAGNIEPTDEEVVKPAKRALRTWITGILLTLLAVGIFAAGWFYYKNYYLQPVETVLLENTLDGVLVVQINSNIDEDKLTVVCSDTYGNQLFSPVINGKATFNGLAPNAAYTVEVTTTGFYKLIGEISTAYTTPQQTSIVQFSAVTGAEEGSAILGFTIDGPDAQQWKITYAADNGEKIETIFSGHTVTVTGLTLGNEYTFLLEPADDTYVTGSNSASYITSKIVTAKNLIITEYTDSKISAAWSAPEDVQIENWTVRCYNNSDFDTTVVTSDTTASFEITNNTADYTVEVTASGMSVNERAFANANSISVSNFTVDSTDPNALRVSWTLPDGVSRDNISLLYTINNCPALEIPAFDGTSAVISPVAPGYSYTFTLKSSDGTGVLGGIIDYKTPEAPAFDSYAVTADDMVFMMCKTPPYSGWNRYDISDSDYTTEFSVGESASFLVRLKKAYNTSSDVIVTTFVIKDENGTVVDVLSTSRTWIDMWYRNYCELDIPAIPEAAGRYTMSVYFNAAAVADVAFSVTE